MAIQSDAKLPFNLKITQTDEKGNLKQDKQFTAMFNPEQFAIREEVELDVKAATGKTGTDPKPIRIKPRDFTVELTLDGTGVNTNGVKIPLKEQVELFRAVTTEIVGKIHRPAYLRVSYGDFICDCTLRSSTVTYTMFDKDGLPIRVKISASFVERTRAIDTSSSPDLTHRVQIQDGDILPLLTYKIYKNQNYYLQVARINKLKNFRKLKPATTLVFPPVSKKPNERNAT